MSRSRVAFLVSLAAFAIFWTPAWAADECPGALALGRADRLVLVLADSMNTPSASVRFYERDAGGEWREAGKARPAVLGRSGMGWSWTHDALAETGERIKTEGDGRTPAGFFKLGHAFGFGAGTAPKHVTLKPGKHFCVDDPASPHYNTVLSRAEAGQGVSGEDMGRIGLYRQGLFVTYPTSRARKGGSCIFVHVWRAPGRPTAGCVALAEPDVKHMQRWSAHGATLIGILPKRAWSKLRHCF